MKRAFFTLLSAVFLFLTFFTYEGMFHNFFMKVSVFTPLLFAVLGLICALFGLKGYMKGIFLTLHSFSLLLFILIILMARYGFQQP